MDAPTDLDLSGTVRAGLRVYGQVQGVGFRPFVFTLATGMSLDGWVRNIGIGVEIEVQGRQAEVERFVHRLTRELPRAARIERIERETRTTEVSTAGFAIIDSTADVTATSISPDSTVCEDCLADMFDPSNRRYRHPFTHCVQCGPRYTISARLPYDRANTSMAAFTECPQCRDEREHAGNRRFHAQTNACPSCGPRIWMADASGHLVQEEDVIAAALARLARGEILAVKGLGGFHLACDARNGDAVRRLRERKAREEKPFAVMFANLASIPVFADMRETEAMLLSSAQRPIVLLPKRADCDAMLPGVAPQLASLGCMLPYAPLHYLLFHEAAGRPYGTQWLDAPQPTVLVMTSANPHGEPLVTGNDEALERLSGIADAFLLHDREILIRCDDSVVRPTSTRHVQFVRRSRGYVPSPVRLATTGAAGLAVGGYLNNTVCVARRGEAFLSEHIGDLETRMACAAFDTTVTHLFDILQVEPRWVACDLHPDFHSTRFAYALAAERGLPVVEVQHHHAHVAAVMAEHGLRGPALGVALDGFGLGSDGGAWGGELLLAEGAAMRRLGHLRPLPLPGGDRAAREPWRMAASALFEMGQREQITARFGPASSAIATMLERNLNSPRTSSAGRLFDAASGLLGVSKVTTFEGQAASLLEGLPVGLGEVAPLQQGYAIAGGVLDMMPLLSVIAGMDDKAQAAALFHATFAAGLAEWVARMASAHGVEDVVLGGGCFINALLSAALRARLETQGLRVFEAAAAPPGDGGLSLGQAWVALQQLDS
ncbi:carbamoyltransferase HypF [Noviherbaspirillum sp. ST9]|uniref:carbamoyltransferase HypF n=1 Tax=Noviherbaspirillum sp. ST9 TaxID=3401606 RepID=UPI003B588CC9